MEKLLSKAGVWNKGTVKWRQRDTFVLHCSHTTVGSSQDAPGQSQGDGAQGSGTGWAALGALTGCCRAGLAVTSPCLYQGAALTVLS